MIALARAKNTSFLRAARFSFASEKSISFPFIITPVLLALIGHCGAVICLAKSGCDIFGVKNVYFEADGMFNGQELISFVFGVKLLETKHDCLCKLMKNNEL